MATKPGITNGKGKTLKRFAYLDQEAAAAGSVQNLGTMNAWGDKKDYPKKYRHCQIRKRKNPHTIVQATIGRCLNKYTCSTCSISWTVDSSD